MCITLTGLFIWFDGRRPLLFLSQVGRQPLLRHPFALTYFGVTVPIRVIFERSIVTVRAKVATLFPVVEQSLAPGRDRKVSAEETPMTEFIL